MSAEVEAAVQAVKSVETLEVMGKLLYNCAVSPREDKFRRVKLTNKKVADTICSTHGEGCWRGSCQLAPVFCSAGSAGSSGRAFAGAWDA